MTKEAFLSGIYSNENQFTAAFNLYVNANYPELRHFYAHIPNENSHKLINLGVLPGFPDFIFLKPETFFIELKMPNGTLSPKQKALHKLWKDWGLKVFTSYNPQQCLDILRIFEMLTGT